jgi:acyl phosphate:glycerol-3-phosphate acyltransferase
MDNISSPMIAIAGLRLPAAIALVLGAYLLGSVPFALLLGKLRGIDIRKVGSGNIGATNLSRALGRSWGIAGFVLDFLKGLLPVLAAGLAGGPGTDGGDVRPEGTFRTEHVEIACALAAVVGHVFPAWLRFRGGKGVATSFGAVAGLAPIAALAGGIVWLGLFLITRTVSIASLAAAAVFPVATVAAYRNAPAAVAVPMDILAALVAGIIVLRHRSNIRRLLTGEEHRF